jgi:hypothetical protein
MPREVGLEVKMSQTKFANAIKQIRLTPLEMEIITGCLLGDGTLSKSGKNYRLRVEHAARHKAYVEWKYNFLKRLCISAIQYDMSNSAYRFGTVGHPEISKLRQQWYPSGKKQVAANVQITPRQTAIWFMDDGTKHRDTVDISVHNFARTDIERLCVQLRKFDINTTVNSDSKGFRLYMLKQSYPNFKKLVKPFIVKCMAYKLP